MWRARNRGSCWAVRSGRCSPWLVRRVPRRRPSRPAFDELVGSAGCLVQPAAGEGGDDCGTAGGLDAAVAVAVAPDQRNVYVASRGTPLMGSNAVVEFARRSETGALGRIGCISDNGADGRVGTDGFCRDGAHCWCERYCCQSRRSLCLRRVDRLERRCLVREGRGVRQPCAAGVHKGPPAHGSLWSGRRAARRQRRRRES